MELVLHKRRGTLSRLLLGLLFASFFVGCGSSAAKKGEALAKDGVSASENLESAYKNAKKANKDSLVFESSLSTIDADGLAEYEKLSKVVGERVRVAGALKSTFSSLSDLSKFDVKKAESAGSELASSITALSSLGGLPALPANLFGWFSGAIAQAKQKKDICKGALALRWACHDLSCVLLLEMGENYGPFLDSEGKVQYKSPPFLDPTKILDSTGHFDRNYYQGVYWQAANGPLTNILVEKYRLHLVVLDEMYGPVPQGSRRFVQGQPYGDAVNSPITVDFRETLAGPYQNKGILAAMTRVSLDLRDEISAVQDSHRQLRAIVNKHDELFGKPKERPTIEPAVELELKKTVTGKRLLELMRGEQ